MRNTAIVRFRLNRVSKRVGKKPYNDRVVYGPEFQMSEIIAQWLFHLETQFKLHKRRLALMYVPRHPDL